MRAAHFVMDERRRSSHKAETPFGVLAKTLQKSDGCRWFDLHVLHIRTGHQFQATSIWQQLALQAMRFATSELREVSVTTALQSEG